MRTPASLLLMLGVFPANVLAQVGHDPARSPYRTLRYGQFLGVTAGRFRGSGGQLGVAPHGGNSLGIRFDFLSTGTVSLGLAASIADLQRVIIDPTQPIATAATDTVPQRTFFAEALVHFNLTGGKSWHHLAPYVSGGLGFALAARTPQDESGFRFRGKFAVTPGIGTRVYLSERLMLRVEARSVFWQVNYPVSYRTAPSSAPSEPPVLAAPVKEWIANGWYAVTLSFAFRRPF